MRKAEKHIQHQRGSAVPTGAMILAAAAATSSSWSVRAAAGAWDNGASGAGLDRWNTSASWGDNAAIAGSATH